MASRIQGITVEIGGDTTKLSKALESVNKSIKGTQSGLKDVNKLLKLDPSNTELVVQKQKMLKDAIEATKEKLAKHNEVSDECRMVEGSRHPCCKDDVPDWCGSGRDTDARRHCGLGCSWQRGYCGRCCVLWYQPCRSARTGETVKKTKEKRARRIRLFQGVVRRRPPQFIAIIYHMGRNYARGFKNC